MSSTTTTAILHRTSSAISNQPRQRQGNSGQRSSATDFPQQLFNYNKLNMKLPLLSFLWTHPQYRQEQTRAPAIRWLCNVCLFKTRVFCYSSEIASLYEVSFAHVFRSTTNIYSTPSPPAPPPSQLPYQITINYTYSYFPQQVNEPRVRKRRDKDSQRC